MGCEFILVVFEEVVAHTFPSRKTGVGLYFATAVTLSAGSYLMIRGLVPYVTWPRALCYEPPAVVRASVNGLCAAVAIMAGVQAAMPVCWEDNKKR